MNFVFLVAGRLVHPPPKRIACAVAFLGYCYKVKDVEICMRFLHIVEGVSNDFIGNSIAKCERSD